LWLQAHVAPHAPKIPVMSIQEHPDQAREEADGVFPWLVVIAMALAVLVALEFSDHYGAFFPT
jgi:hypothetical protein